MKSLKDITEGVAVSSDFKLVNSVDANGKPTTRKVRAHRKTISPKKDDSEEKTDVLASIQKFVGRQYAEEVESVEEGRNDTPVPYGSLSNRPSSATVAQTGPRKGMITKKHATRLKDRIKSALNKEEVELDEVSTDGYYKAAIKSRMDAAVKVASSMGKDKEAKTKLDARNRGMKRVENRTRDEMNKANSGPQRHQPAKSPSEAEQRGYGQGRYMGDSVELDGEVVVEAKKSAAVRWQEALQRAKQQRETEEARKKENEKRALTPVKEQYVGSGESKDMQRAVDIARLRAKTNMLKDIHGDNFQDKPVPAHDESDVKVAPNDKGGYSASLKLTPKAKPAPTNESKDDEDYSKHHKLDPDSGVEADQHIHVQLKKASDSTMKPYEVTFKNGKKHSVSSPVAKTIVSAVEKLKPEHRKAVHDELHKSYDSLMAVHKAITGK